jgi:ketosteroid isomerase-like protein
MPSREQVREAVEQHVRLWNAGDKEAWLDVFAAECLIEDPVGTPPKPLSSASWDVSHTGSGETIWKIEIERMIVSGAEAAVWLHTRGVIEGREYSMEYLGNWTVDDDGRICRARVFIEIPDEGLRDQPGYRDYEEGRL